MTGSYILPNADQAVIDPRKLRDYALNPNHPTGRFKAIYFADMGYTQADWPQLEADIRTQHLTRPAQPGAPSPFGVKYEITAPITGPNGITKNVTTVWIYKSGGPVPELVTIQPGPKKP
jgi:hypothetical protein